MATISGSDKRADSLVGTSGDDIIFGFGRNDTIRAGGGNDSVDGGDGDDWIFGDAGNDTIAGGLGNDTLRGSIGDDYYIVESQGDVAEEALDEGKDTVSSSISWTLGANFETLILTGATALNGSGNELNNTITGNIGNN